jgi:predicted amidohydrolase YtcJ
MSADLILSNGRFTTLNPSSPTATAVAVTGGRFADVGRETEIMPLAGPARERRAARQRPI